MTRKLRKKQRSDDPDEDLFEDVEPAKRRKRTGRPKRKAKYRKRYKPAQCAYMINEDRRCKKKAVGSSTLCEKHGGNVRDKKNLISVSELSANALVNLKFNPAIHPIQFIQYAQCGMSEVEIAAKFMVSVEKMRGWAEKFEEFATAYDIGRQMMESWYLQRGKENLENPRFQTALYKHLTGNVLGYSDKIENRNLNAHAHGVLLVPNEMSMDDWEAANKKEKAEREAQSEAVDAEYTEVSTDDSKK